MKKSFSFVLAALAVFFLVFTGCKIESSPSSKSVKKYNGTIYGKAFYSNTEDNSSIQITLDKTDGLRSAAVLESCGINDRSCYSIDGSSSDSRTVVSYTACDENGSYSFSNLEPGVYTVYALAKDSSERAVSRNISVVEDGKVLVPDLQLTATGSLSGKITVEGNESNNAGFVVFIAGTSYMAITDLDGSFEISNIPAGKDYSIVIMYGTYTYYWKNDVEIKPFVTSSVGEKVFTKNEYQNITNKQKGEDGQKGDTGKDGTSIVWKGSFDSEEKIKNPEYLWAYFNTEDGCSYIYDGEKWVLLASKGDRGDKGEKGDAGKDASKYEIRTTDIAPGEQKLPAGGIKIEVLKDGEVIEVKYIENGTSGITYLNYELDGGSFSESPILSTTYGNTIILIEPKKEHFTFMGWYLSKDFTGDKIEEIKCDGTQSNVTIYAKWLPKLYVTFETNGGSFTTTPKIEYEIGDSVEMIIPIKEHFTFMGWYLSKDFTGDKIEEIKCDGTQSNVTIYAKWLPKLYVTFETNGGSFTTTPKIEYEIGESIQNVIPTKESLSFAGWYYEQDFSGNQVKTLPTDSSKIEITVYAKWVIKHYTIDELQNLITSFTPQEAPYTIYLSGEIDFSILRDILQEISSGIYIDLILPDSVTDIENDAFSYCSSLKSIKIPENVTSIGEDAFSSCTSLKNINIPDSVISIGNYAFFECSSLENINIPDSVISIGNCAFSDCYSLTSINIPSNVTSIGESTFCCCYSLTNIIIPNSVTSIGDLAFSVCTSLTSINIPDSVTYIKYAAFTSCTSLTSITIPSSVTSIGENVFFECPSLENIIVDSNNPIYDSRNNCNALIETATNTLLCGSSNTIIPNSITSIGDYAFFCSSLTSINIPESVTSIGDCAFLCSSLTSINIPESVTSIGDYAFSECSSLTNIIIPNSVTSIGEGVFYDCNSLTSLTFDDTTTWYKTDDFTDWINKTGGTETDVSDPARNANDFVASGCYWYKL